MDLNLTGKNALICASSGGIGKGIAKGLAIEGANISILGRDEEKLAAAEKELSAVAKGKVIATQCDLSKEEDIKRVFEKTNNEFGSIDILINNQGGPIPGIFENISIEDTKKALELNLLSNFIITKLCLPGMKEKKWGRIINILSVSAKEPIPNMYLSNMIRPAVIGFAKSIALDYAALGITVNNLLPAAVLSDRTSFFVQKSADEKGISFDEALKNEGAGLPTKYIATPEEFSQLAIFLASENSSYINGTSICVDGGLSKGLL